MIARGILYTGLTAIIVGLAGCSSDGSLGLTTASVADNKPKKTAKKIDPFCMTLRDQIVALRNEGTIGRVEKVATGKTKIVRLKRASLAKVAELNRLNDDFRNRCSDIPVIALPQTQKPKTPQLVTAAPARPAAKKIAATPAAAKKVTAAQVKAKATAAAAKQTAAATATAKKTQ